MPSAIEALEILRQGNRRFVSGSTTVHTLRRQSSRPELVMRRQPFAVVLGCADSRVPVEIVFDCAFGDLFVIRVGGKHRRSVASRQYRICRRTIRDTAGRGSWPHSMRSGCGYVGRHPTAEVSTDGVPIHRFLHPQRGVARADGVVSCAIGAPNNAMIPWPMTWFAVPSYR
jgi:hypothetical protein